MAATPPAEPNRPSPNAVMRALRGNRSPGEFAMAVRRAAREIGEHVSCDARYVGRVESGEIRCPNYAYERVFRHMWPDRTLADLGFTPRTAVRCRPADGGRGAAGAPPLHPPFPPPPAPRSPLSTQLPYAASPYADPAAPEGPPWPVVGAVPRGPDGSPYLDEENDDVRRRTFLAGGSTALAAVIGIDRSAAADPAAGADFGPATGRGAAPGAEFAAPPLLGFDPVVPGRPGPVPPARKVGAAEVLGVEQAVREIRLADDAHGADALYELAGQSLRTAYLLLNEGDYSAETERRLQSGAGELAISVGWLAHDSNRLADARSFYAEALATARMAGDSALEAHVFCNSAFLARDTGRPREALRAAQAGQAAARQLGSDRLLALLAMREAGAWALLRDRAACERAISRAYTLFDRGPSEDDPEWMSFFGDAEISGLQSQCWSALGDWDRASEQAALAIALQEPHFVRNRVLYTAELAHDRLGRGDLAGAAHHGSAAVALFGEVRSARIRSMLADTAGRLRRHAAVPEVRRFLVDYDQAAAA
ncbi:tetratricopeptide repeat protein [Kitasatospora sp. SUK 42]|uniref:tetratricopeptide repeat protein n=1 Tax=Kitasatospora sp. SUK 42 TaxID=1588882 RepID=UPI0018C91D2A|nr:tetratricopeptide repeat protein [Kitasatospora sp. SUK 42]MBV2154049.1 tetratricopeptide repeat protein [Kitasatospora sp. SUK 42]